MKQRAIWPRLCYMMILISAVGCQVQASGAAAPPLPTIIELPTVVAQADVTDTPRPVSTLAGLPSTNTPPATATSGASPSPSITPTSSRTALPTASSTASLTPIPTRRPLPSEFRFGQSVEGRDLVGYRFGDGDTLLMLVGGIHGGWEANTVDMSRALIDHFEADSTAILPGMTIIVIPMLNPDGIALGRTVEGRFNANSVDLNRNWGCGWEPIAYFQNRTVSPGDRPFSEPESAALAALINDIRPDAVLFYHSAADGVFSGDCDTGDGRGTDSDSDGLAVVVGQATGYSYGSEFSAYKVTGTAPSWVDSLGIPSADVELATWQNSEFSRNLRGVMAVQCWLLDAQARGLSACQP